MRSEQSIRELLDIMEQAYQTGKYNNEDLPRGVIMPADAYECANTLHWVLGEVSGIEETLYHCGIEL